MRRLLTLPRLAISVWVVWFVLLATLAGLLGLRMWHPHFLPISALVVLFASAGLLLIFSGVRQLIRVPGRLRSLAWLLLGTTPLWLMAGHFLYCLGAAYGNHVRNRV